MKKYILELVNDGLDRDEIIETFRGSMSDEEFEGFLDELDELKIK